MFVLQVKPLVGLLSKFLPVSATGARALVAHEPLGAQICLSG